MSGEGPVERQWVWLSIVSLIVVLFAVSLVSVGAGGGPPIGHNLSAGDSTTAVPDSSEEPDEHGADFQLVDSNLTIETTDQESLSQADQAAAEAGAETGIALAQEQGVTITQEQRQAATDAAIKAVNDDASAAQIENATKGAVHGALVQHQDINVTQLQSVVGGSASGALSQHQTANATQLQSAAWGASHGTVAQSQAATVEQLQYTARGAAGGAAYEAGAKEIGHVSAVQEAAQGAAHGALDRTLKAPHSAEVTTVQRQEITVEQYQHAAAGAAAGVLDGVHEQRQKQKIDIEQRQHVTVKQIQKAAMGAAKGTLVQKQQVTVEQTQAAARGAGKGALSITQIQRVTVVQIQKAAVGSATGAIYQSQEATIEQIYAAAVGSAEGVLIQRQEVRVEQIQYAALGAAHGTVVSAVQHQIVSVEQIQAVAKGASEGAVTQVQVVNVVQVQAIAYGASAGVLVHAEQATTVQLYTTAKATGPSVAAIVQHQRITIEQIQRISIRTATTTISDVVDQEIDEPDDVRDRTDDNARDSGDEEDELEGDAAIAFIDQHAVDGTQVTIDEVYLERGGFVAVHDGVFGSLDAGESIIGVSEYLEPGTYENVTITVFDDVPGQQFDRDALSDGQHTLTAVAYHDTNDNEQFDYLETDAEEDLPYVRADGTNAFDRATVTVEPDPEGMVDVTDQTGDGETLTVDNATANVDFVLEARYDGETVRSQPFTSGERVVNETIDLEPPIDANTTVEVAVIAVDDEEELATDEVAYTLDVAPTAELTVTDQTGDGETVTIDQANASIPFALEARYDNETVQSDPFEADQAIENQTFDLDPPIETNTTVDVAVVVAEDDSELAVETITYIVDERPDPPTGNLTVFDQAGDGSTFDVERANASVDYYLEITFDDTQTESEPFDAGDPIENHTIVLDQPIEENTTVDVTVRAIEDDEELATDTIEYTVEEESVDGLNVRITDVPDSLAPGYVLDVAFEVENEGNTTEEVPIELDINEQESADNMTISLEPGDSARGTLTYHTTEDDIGEQVVTVRSPDDTATADIEILDERPAPEIEFQDCTTAEIRNANGFETVYVFSRYYSGAGLVPLDSWIGVSPDSDRGFDEPLTGTAIVTIGDEHQVYEDDEGRTVIEIPGRGINGSVLSLIHAYDDEVHSPGIGSEDTTHVEASNPQEEDCIEEIRPAEPDLWLEDVNWTGENTAEVTYGYENPHDQPLSVPSQFVEGTTPNTTLTQLDPGEHTVTVRWTPETEEERLVLEVDHTRFGYDEPMRVATEPAGEYDRVDSELAVTITNTTDPVETGQPIEVTADIENVGNESADAEIALDIDDQQEVDNTTVGLEPGETEATTLSYQTDADDVGERNVTVRGPDDQATTTVEVIEEPATALEVSDQTGDGTELSVDQATAQTDFYIAAQYDGEIVESEQFEAGQEIENLTLDLDPTIEENTTVEVTIHAAADGEQLASQAVDYGIDEVPIEFLNCQTVRITGDYEGIMLDVWDWRSMVGGGYMWTDQIEDEVGPIEGETVIDVNDLLGTNMAEERESEFIPVYIDSVHLSEEGDVDYPEDPDHRGTNPFDDDAASCEEHKTGEQSTASVTFDDQQSDGASITVDEVTLSHGGFVAIYDEDVEGAGFPSSETAVQHVLGASNHLDAGTHENVTVELEEPLDDEQTVIAVPHLDTTASGTFDFAESNGFEDWWYINPESGHFYDPPRDSATISVEEDRTPDEFDVDFTDCTTAEITGPFEDGDVVTANLRFYDVDGTMGTAETDVTVGEEFDPPETLVVTLGDDDQILEAEDGTIVVERSTVGSFADFLETVHVELSDVSDDDQLSVDNPNTEECLAELRADEPSVSVENVEPTVAGSFNVTFGYDNPNDIALEPPVSTFVEGTTTGEPPETLEAGEHEFTVEWDPQTDGERLAWEVDFQGGFEFPEPFRAETDPAAEYDLPEPELAITITDATDPVEMGQPVNVTVEVENVGDAPVSDAPGEDEIVLDAGGQENLDNTTVALDGGDSTVTTLTAPTDNVPIGPLELTVRSADDTDTRTVTIEEAAEPAEFTVEILGVNDPVEAGEELVVRTEIVNVGDETGIQTIQLEVAGQPAVDETELTLDGGESALAELVYQTDDTDVGDMQITVSSANHTDSQSVSITAAETPTPEPDTPTPEPDTPTPDPDTPTPDQDTPTPAPETPTPAPDTPTPEPETPTPEPATPTPEPDPPDQDEEDEEDGEADG